MKILSIDCGIKNLAFVILDIREDKVEIPFFSMIDLTSDKVPDRKENFYMTPRSKRRVRTMTQKVMLDKLLRVLDAFREIDLFVGIDSFLIERQMNRCTSMKQIETALYFYFKIRFSEKNIVIVDPRLKLRRELKEAGKKISYSVRKKMSLNKAKGIVGKDQQIYGHLNFDLADCICQAVEWSDK